MRHTQSVQQHYTLDNIPASLKAIPRWSAYSLIWSAERNKFDKIPKNIRTGGGLSSKRIEQWRAFDEVEAALASNSFDGPGFALYLPDRVVAIDLDNCAGESWALDLIARMDSYTELSPSRKGYRIFLRGAIERDWTNHQVGIEVYAGHSARFVTVTGWHVEGTPIDVNRVDPIEMAEVEGQYRKASASADVIDLTMPEIIDADVLPKLEDLPIPDGSKRFLLEGDFTGDRSGTLFACGVSLYAAGFADGLVLSILYHNPFAWGVALDHRRQDEDRALMYLWREHCVKARSKGIKAIASADEFDVVPVADDEKPLPRFARDKNGRIEATIDNVFMAVCRADFCGVSIKYDVFRDEIMFTLDGQPMGWRPFRDCDYVELRLVLERRGFKAIGRELIRDVVLKVADDNKFDTAILWLESLTWDGVPRVERFLADYFGTDDTQYTRAVSQYMWSAMAGRVLQPGVKADMVPILVGAQGALKSSSIAAMAPGQEFFTEISFHEKEDDLARRMRGKLIGEIGELRGLHTREQEFIKAFITRTHEIWVPKFREFATMFPRRLIFIGTTNQDQFLSDDTGNRRWCPVKVTKADIDAVRRDRDQLWAEAAVLFDLLGVMYQAAEKLAVDEHEEFTMPERWLSEIGDWLDTPDALTGDSPRTRGFLRVTDVARECLHVDTARLSRADELQICKILRMLGFERKKPRVEGRTQWGFVPLVPEV